MDSPQFTTEPFDVIIVGCGPTGAMLAAELRLHDVRVLVLEKETEPVSFARIVGLHIRSIELMAMRGLLDRILEHGRRRPAGGFFAAIAKPAPEGLDSAHAYLLGIPQPVIVRLLEDHAIELGAQVRRGCAVAGFEQDDRGVTVELAGGERLRSRYLVGCDGGRSTVRTLLGVGFPGRGPRRGSQRSRGTAHPRGFQKTAAHYRRNRFRRALPALVVPLRGCHPASRTLSGRAGAAGRRCGTHPSTHRRTGLNLGVQDAVNLGWKLAAQIRGWAPETLLDTYQSERHPLAEDVLTNTRAQMELLSTEPGPQAVRRLLTELMDFDEVNRYLIEKITAIDIRYDFGAGQICSAAACATST